MRNPFIIYAMLSKFIHIHGTYMLFVIKNVIITCKQSMQNEKFGAF